MKRGTIPGFKLPKGFPMNFKLPGMKKFSLPALVMSILLLLFGWFQETFTSYSLPRADQPAEILSNQLQADLRGTFANAIKSAKSSVLLLVYSLSDPVITKALKEKSEEGVPVYIVCDGDASRFAKGKLGPIVNLHLHNSQGLMHQKILVIDQKMVWIGSANMTSDSLRVYGNLVEAFEHPQAAEWIQERSMALFNSGKNLSRPKPLTIPLKDQQGDLYILPDVPLAVNRLRELIQTAQKSVRVAMFTFTRMDLAHELADAHERGLEVGVVFDRNSSVGASKHVLEFLRSRGVPVYISRGPGLMHHKFSYIDEKILVNGSANWTKAAFTQNADCFMILSPLDSKQSVYMNDLWRLLTIESDPFL